MIMVASALERKGHLDMDSGGLAEDLLKGYGSKRWGAKRKQKTSSYIGLPLKEDGEAQ